LQTLATKSGNTSKRLAKENGGGGGGGGGGGSGGSGGSGGGGGGGGDGNKRTFKFTRNMGAYCYLCGHQPIRGNHTSVTCTRKRDGHNDLATTNHRFGGSNFLSARPSKVQRKICQQLTGTGAG